MNQIRENGKKPNFGPDVGRFSPCLGPKNFKWVLPLLVGRHNSKLLSYAIFTKTNETNLTK